MDELRARISDPVPLLPNLISEAKRRRGCTVDALLQKAHRIDRILRGTLRRDPVVQDLLSPPVIDSLRASTATLAWTAYYRPFIRGTVYAWLGSTGVAPAFVPGMEDWLGRIGYALHRPVRNPKQHDDPPELVRFGQYLALSNPEADHGRVLRCVRAFFAWCGDNRGTGARDLSPDDVRSWLEHLRAEPLSPRSLSSTVTMVRRFLKYAEDRGIVAAGLRDSLPPMWVDLPTNARALTGEESRRLLLGAAHDPLDPLLWATLVAAHFDTAGRPREVLNLLGEDARQENGLWVVTLHGGKRRDPTDVELSPTTTSLMDRYLSVRPLQLGSPFFRHRNGEPVGYQNYKDHFQAWLSHGPEGHGVGPHAIRHTVLTWMDRAGEGLSSIRSLSGHRSANGLQPYLHPDRAAIHAAVADALRTLEGRA